MFLSLAFGGFREVVPLLFNRDLAHWSLPEVQRQGPIMQNLSSVILDCLSGSRLGTRQYFCGPVEHCGKARLPDWLIVNPCVSSARHNRRRRPGTTQRCGSFFGAHETGRCSGFHGSLQTWLRAQMARATIAGQLDVLINCGRLYRSLGGYPGFIHGMPLCCDAMQAEFKPGDTMILDRTNGAGMTVRYLLPLPK
jgi:hypothetical protein